MKQPPTITDLPTQKDGESDDAYEKRLNAFISGDDIRTKTDLRDWTGSFPFHLDGMPSSEKK